MMPSAYTPLFYGSNWVVRLGQVCSDAAARQKAETKRRTEAER